MNIAGVLELEKLSCCVITKHGIQLLSFYTLGDVPNVPCWAARFDHSINFVIFLTNYDLDMSCSLLFLFKDSGVW